MSEPTAEELKAFAAKHLPPELPEKVPEPPKDPLEALRKLPKRHVCVALLSYNAQIYVKPSVALTIAAATCGELGWGFSYLQRESDSMVARGRSQLASRFLSHESCKDFTDLVFIDTDVYSDGDDLIRLLSHEVDVVAGCYPFKNDSGNFPLRWSSQGLIEQNGLWVVQSAVAGFMRIRRSALSLIATEMPWLEYNDNHGDANHRTWMFFDNLHRNNGIYDESYIFCERYRGCGGTVYVDPDLNLKHIGLKIYDHGSLRRWNDEMTQEVMRLNKKYPNLPTPTLFNKLQANRMHWKRLREAVGHLDKIQAMEAELAKEQAAALKAGAPPVVLDGVDNKKPEGEEVEEDRVDELPMDLPPLPKRGTNGAAHP